MRQHALRYTASLNVAVARHSTMGDRSFCVAAACVWNSLPSVVTSASSLLVFRRLLKTELYCRSFPDNQHVILWCSSELWLWLCLTLLGVLVVFLTLRHLNLFVYNNNIIIITGRTGQHSLAMCQKSCRLNSPSGTVQECWLTRH